MGEIEEFIEDFEEQVLRELRIQALDIALKATPARWWGTHKQNLQVWDQVKIIMKIRFG